MHKYIAHSINSQHSTNSQHSVMSGIGQSCAVPQSVNGKFTYSPHTISSFGEKPIRALLVGELRMTDYFTALWLGYDEY